MKNKREINFCYLQLVLEILDKIFENYGSGTSVTRVGMFDSPRRNDF